jgi:hypothetical protein
MFTSYRPGQWNAICDRCGFGFKSSELKRDWQGLIVCDKDYETRHPQDFIRIRPEKPAADWARPENTDLVVLICDINNSQGIAGISVAGCMVAGKVRQGIFE